LAEEVAKPSKEEITKKNVHTKNSKAKATENYGRRSMDLKGET